MDLKPSQFERADSTFKLKFDPRNALRTVSFFGLTLGLIAH